MLVISRKENQSIRIEPAPGISPAMTLLEAFEHGALVVKLMRVGGRRVRLVIEAPRALRVSRDQSPEPDALPSSTPSDSPPAPSSLAGNAHDD
jgi:sRNA-binding carbon storage regulator CsrA